MAAPLRGCDVSRRRPEGPQAGTRAGVAGDVLFRAPYTETGFNVKHGRPWPWGRTSPARFTVKRWGWGVPPRPKARRPRRGARDSLVRFPLPCSGGRLGAVYPKPHPKFRGTCVCPLARDRPIGGRTGSRSPVFDESMRLLGRNRLNMLPREVARLLSPELLPDAIRAPREAAHPPSGCSRGHVRPAHPPGQVPGPAAGQAGGVREGAPRQQRRARGRLRRAHSHLGKPRA